MTTTLEPETCAGETRCCPDPRPERPRYFPRQLITPAEMTLEQDYFRARLRLHNRMLHGWGVVCGALVCPVPVDPPDPIQRAAAGGAAPNRPGQTVPWQVVVQPGYALGPCGDEIVIPCDHLVDLRTPGGGGPCDTASGESRDPWCSEVWEPREPGPLWVAVRYAETATRPVRTQPAGCGCEGERCEYSRWRDGYEIGILTACPPSHAGDPPDLDDLWKGPCPPCPPCPDDPWVVLAKVELAPDGSVLKIDNCSCRRLVIAFGSSWWRCSPAMAGGGRPTQGETPPIENVPGAGSGSGSGIVVKPVAEQAPKSAAKPAAKRPAVKGR